MGGEVGCVLSPDICSVEAGPGSGDTAGLEGPVGGGSAVLAQSV